MSVFPEKGCIVRFFTWVFVLFALVYGSILVSVDLSTTIPFETVEEAAAARRVMLFYSIPYIVLGGHSFVGSYRLLCVLENKTEHTGFFGVQHNGCLRRRGLYGGNNGDRLLHPGAFPCFVYCSCLLSAVVWGGSDLQKQEKYRRPTLKGVLSFRCGEKWGRRIFCGCACARQLFWEKKTFVGSCRRRSS